MARIRTIKPEFWSDDKIVSLPFVARLFFIGLWNFADDFGALPDKPEQLKLLILPSEENIEVARVLDILLAADLIERYIDVEEDKSFLVIKNWNEHQKVDHPTRSKLIKQTAKKATIPNWLRRKVADKYKCKPGNSKDVECYFCGEAGTIYWTKKSDGSPSGWVSFSLELSHLIPEVDNGELSEQNIVLACRNCNRSMGTRHAFDWLINGKYFTNQINPEISLFRQRSGEFANTIEESNLKGKEGKGMERKLSPNGVGDSQAKSPPGIQEVFKNLIKEKKEIVQFIRDHKPDFIEPYIELWNLFASEKKLPQVSKITTSRRKKFNVRFKEKGFDFLFILKRASASEFLLTNKWFGFDWIMENETNYLKVMEGNYDKNQAKAPAQNPSQPKPVFNAGIKREVNYLYEKYCENSDDFSTISVEEIHFTELNSNSKLEVIADKLDDIQVQAKEQLNGTATDEMLKLMMKKLSVIEFFKYEKHKGHATIFGME